MIDSYYYHLEQLIDEFKDVAKDAIGYQESMLVVYQMQNIMSAISNATFILKEGLAGDKMEGRE